jgi:RNA polymerase sigma factor (sigma-70 family)
VDADDTAALVHSAATGDAGAWTTLVHRFSNLVWSVARAYRLGNADAEDVYQVTWLRLTEHLDRLSAPDRVGAWLATTARNEALKVIRGRSRVTVTDDPYLLDGPSDVDSPERLALDAEEGEQRRDRVSAVWAAFGLMSAHCQRLLRVLMATPRLSYAEIAQLLDIPIGSIGPTRARCLARLRGLLPVAGPGALATPEG